MNLTVGPLPPAVYWRRRALVLGAVVALVILLVSMCGGANGAQTRGHPTAATSTTSRSPSPTATPSVQAPIVGAPGAASRAPSSAPPSTAAPASAASDICSDAEIQLTPSVQKINGGSYPYQFTLRIKNISTRTCKRDVGSGPQEMHIVNSSGQTVWSSDNCQSGTTGSDLRTFNPNIESAFQLGWDGNANAPGCRSTGALNGTYQLVAKLDTKVSAPVTFTIGPAGITEAGK